MTPHLLSGVILLAAFASATRASDPVSSGPVEFSGRQSSRWSVGIGVVFRPISADFASHGPGPLGLALPGASATGRGDAGVYLGGAGTTDYDGGSVGPDLAATLAIPDPTGFAEADAGSGVQIVNTGRPDGTGGTIQEYRFHSHLSTVSYATAYSPRTVGSSDEETGMGACIELRYDAMSTPGMSLAFTFDYSWISAGLGSGDATVARESLVRTTTLDTYTYAYDYSASLDALLYDLATANGALGPPPAGSDFHDPRRQHERESSARAIATYVATARTELEVWLHEFLWSAEVSTSPAPWLHLGIAAGPTLNLIDTSLETNGAWRKAGSRRPVATFHDDSHQTLARLGVACQGVLRVDLSPTVFFQAASGYHFVPEVHVANAMAEAWVDASSWQTTVGFGCRF